MLERQHSNPTDTHARRDLALEAIRGLAAITVLLWHSMLGFFPRQSGSFPDFHHSGMRAMPWFGLFNGTAAVTVFFVLSGLVLSRAHLRTGDLAIIIRGAVKRWPRLVGPVVLIVIASALIDRCGLYHFDQVGALTNSPWLAGHLFQGAAASKRGFVDAFGQGVLTFFRGDSYYDTSLWTMRYEMTGSFLVFGLAALLGQIRHSTGSSMYILMIYILIYLYLDVNMLAFVAGVALAYLQVQKAPSIPVGISALMLLIGIYLLGYSGLKAGWYAELASILQESNVIYMHILGAMLIISAVDGAPNIKKLFQGRTSAALGKLSFPLYLVHIPILCSAGCTIFLVMLPITGPRLSSLAAAVSTIGLSFVAALPVAWLNDKWVAQVDRCARWATLRTDAPTSRQSSAS